MSESLGEVLIAEDERIIREMLRDTLENAGYQVYEAADGRAALRILHHSPCPMVVILDSDLPGAGAEAILAGAARDTELGQHAFVYLTSARPEQEPPAIRRLLSELAVPVLRTPFTTEMLVQVVGQVAHRPVPGSPLGSSTSR